MDGSKRLTAAGICMLTRKENMPIFIRCAKTFATMLILAGVPHRVVMELMAATIPVRRRLTDAGDSSYWWALSSVDWPD